MDPDSSIPLVVALMALLLFALMAAAEAALRSVGPARLQRLLGSSETSLSRMGGSNEANASILLSAVTVAKALVLLAYAAGASSIVSPLYGSDQSQGLLVAAFLILGVILAQVAPGTAAARHSDTVAQQAIRTAQVVALLLGPAIKLMASATEFVLSHIGAKAGPDGAGLTSEDLRRLLGATCGLPDDEREMVQRILELEQTSAHEVMVPRIDIAAVSADTPLTQVIDLVIYESHSRIPVYTGSIDSIVGIAYAKDLFRYLKAGSLDLPIKEVMRPAYFVPESKRINELLRELLRKKVHIAIVVDEYGGTSGLVTIEDLLEEIVGEIQDEYDTEEERIILGEEGEAVVDGMVSIDDLNEKLGLNLTADGVDTIGGLVLHLLGRVPTTGDEVGFDEGTITVLSVVRRRIKWVKIKRDTLERSDLHITDSVEALEPNSNSNGHSAPDVQS